MKPILLIWLLASACSYAQLVPQGPPPNDKNAIAAGVSPNDHNAIDGCYQRKAGDGCNIETVCGDQVSVTAVYCSQGYIAVTSNPCDETQVKLLEIQRDEYKRIAKESLELNKEYERKFAALRKSLKDIKKQATPK